MLEMRREKYSNMIQILLMLRYVSHRILSYGASPSSEPSLIYRSNLFTFRFELIPDVDLQHDYTWITDEPDEAKADGSVVLAEL